MNEGEREESLLVRVGGGCLLLVVSREDRPIQRREKFNFKKIPPPIVSPAPCEQDWIRFFFVVLLLPSGR